MKRGQTLKKNGYECILFPMEYLNISQGNNGQFSHKGVNAIDITGKDAGIDPTFSPVAMHLVATDSYPNGNAVFMQSDNKVLFADGTVDYATFMFLHDNYIADISQVRSFKQGQEFGDEGTAGFATGNHCHFECAKGRFSHMYDQNSYGTYHLPGSISADKACFIDGTIVKNNGQPTGSGNRMSWKYSNSADTTTSKNELVAENGAMKITVDLINARLNSPTGNVVRQYKMNNVVKYQWKYVGNGHRYIVWAEGSNKIYLAVSGSETYGVDKWAEPTEMKQISPTPSKPNTSGLTEEKGKVTFKVDQVNARKNSPTGEVVKQFMSGESQNYDYKYVGNGHRYIVYKDGNDLIYVAVTPTEERSTEWVDFGEQDAKPTEQPKPEEKNDDVEQPDLEPELYKPTNGWLERNGIAMAYKLVDKSNYAVKCPYVIQKAFPVVHNAGTPGDPDAATLTQSMLNAKSDNTSWHFSVDEKTIVQNLPLNRNCFAQGDFSTGWKSKNGISVEICRDMGSELFEKSELASCVLIADLLYQNGWKASDIKKHQDFDMKDANGNIVHKNCPHKTLDLGWDRYVQMVQKKYDELLVFVNPKPVEEPKVEETDDEKKTFFKLWNKLLKRVLGEK